MEIIILTIFLLSILSSLLEGIWFAIKGSRAYGISVKQAFLSEVDKSFIAPSILKDLIDDKVSLRPIRYFLKVFVINLFIWPYSIYAVCIKLFLMLLVNTIHGVASSIREVAVYLYDSYKKS